MDDAAPGGHPEHITSPEGSFVSISQRTFDDERNSLKATMWMRAPGWPTRFEIDPVIHQQNEGIALLEVVRFDDGNGGVSLTNEPR